MNAELKPLPEDGMNKALHQVDLKVQSISNKLNI